MIRAADPNPGTGNGRTSRGRNAGLLLVAAVLAVAMGYLWGSHQQVASEMHGTAYSTPEQISVAARGVTYNVPVRIPWLGADKVWNDGSRPACLPPDFQQVPVTFGAVAWKHGDVGGYTVTWVDCSR